MNKQIHSKPRIARFRRWSRAAYAVFASLSLVVSIGVLSVSVSDKSAQKSNRYIADLKATTITNGAEDAEDAELLYNDPAQLQAGNILVNQIANNAPARCLGYIYNQSSTVEMGNCLFQPFLF